MEHEWKVGDEVTVCNSDPWRRVSGYSIHKVARVLKRYIVLDDDSKFSHHGYSYPHSSSRSHVKLVYPVTDEHREGIRRPAAIRMMETLRESKWEMVTTAKLEAAVELMK